jgi:hypothetical protein
MPHLLALPFEVRTLIYDYCLKDAQIAVSEERVEWCHSGPAYVQLLPAGLQAVHALVQVNRQLRAEVRPMIASRTRLVIESYCFLTQLDKVVPPAFLQQVQCIDSSTSCLQQNFLGGLSRSMLPNLQHLSWTGANGLNIRDILATWDDPVWGRALFPHIPHAHSQDWEKESVTYVVELILPAGGNPILDEKVLAWAEEVLEPLKGHIPQSCVVDMTIAIGRLMQGYDIWGSALWVSTSSFLSI